MDTHSAQLIASIFAGEKDSIPYRPKVAKVLSSVTAAILLQQILYRWEGNDLEPFYKFKEPCQHSFYREGDSWCEELGFTRSSFDTALRKIAVKKQQGMTMAEAHFLAAQRVHPVVYWVNAGRLTYYTVNFEVLLKVLQQAYESQKLLLKLDSYFSKSGVPTLAKAGIQLYLKQDSDVTITENTREYQENTTNPETAPPSGNGVGDYHLIDLDEEIQAGTQVARNRVQVSCPDCQASISQQMDKCPDCEATIIWKGSKTWTSKFGSVKKYIRKLKGISLKPLTDYERRFTRFFGRAYEFVSEKQAADVRWLQAHKPEAMLMGQIDWGVQNKRAWQQVVAAGKNPACLNRHTARSRPNSDDDYVPSESEKEQIEESRQEEIKLRAEMEAVGGPEEWKRQLLAED